MILREGSALNGTEQKASLGEVPTEQICACEDCVYSPPSPSQEAEILSLL